MGDSLEVSAAIPVEAMTGQPATKKMLVGQIVIPRPRVRRRSAPVLPPSHGFPRVMSSCLSASLTVDDDR